MVAGFGWRQPAWVDDGRQILAADARQYHPKTYDRFTSIWGVVDMPVLPVPAADEKYYLLEFDKKGAEVKEQGKLLSDEIRQNDSVYSDVFLLIHGWKGDIPEAKAQYDLWIGAMVALAEDRARMEVVRPNGFRPLWIGLHWPSLPWGDEDPNAPLSFAAGALDALVDDFRERLGGGEELVDPLRQIIGHAQVDAAPPVLPDEVATAYRDLNDKLNLPAVGVAGAPDGDRRPFDPKASYAAALQQGQLAFGGGGLKNAILNPLRQLSFWTMKKRAKTVGENGFHPLLSKLMDRLGPDVRFHLMGHSFGCIAASAAICGPAGSQPRKIASLALVQGALSLWSYCPKISYTGGPGYFSRLAGDGLVTGPTITTQSKHDRAVGFFYPIAAGVAGQVDYALGLPEFGGVGAFGAQGLDADATNGPMLPADGRYDMGAGRILNLEATPYICKGGGFSGAHSDIAGPEVAHAVWSAAIEA
jgi:hypothetical protein